MTRQAYSGWAGNYEWLAQQYLSPLFGMRQIAASLVRDWGYEPAEHPALMDELEAAVSEVCVDTAYEVMREHGLPGPADREAAESAVRAQLEAQ